MNKEVEPSFFFFWPASSNGPFFFFFAVHLLEWMEEEEEEEVEEDEGNLYVRGRTAMETRHEHTAIHWKSSSLTGSNYFWDTLKNILEKNTCYATGFFFFFFFYEISFTLIADLVCYATCDIVIVSLTGLQSDMVETLLC